MQSISTENFEFGPAFGKKDGDMGKLGIVDSTISSGSGSCSNKAPLNTLPHGRDMFLSLGVWL